MGAGALRRHHGMRAGGARPAPFVSREDYQAALAAAAEAAAVKDSRILELEAALAAAQEPEKPKRSSK